jgi:hypothetical protein
MVEQAMQVEQKSLPSIETTQPEITTQGNPDGKGMSGIQMGKEPHGIEMKIPIQSGNVSKRETIEASIKIARLMI